VACGTCQHHADALPACLHLHPQLADGLAPVRCEPTELVAKAGRGAGTAYLVTSGELLQLAPGAALPASGPVDLAALGDSLLAGRLAAGDITHESAVAGSGSLQVSLVAGPAGASVVHVTAAAVEAVLKRSLGKSAPAAAAPRRTSPPLRMKDLELHRVVGTGQFGLVRLVRHIPTGEVYALKVGEGGLGAPGLACFLLGQLLMWAGPVCCCTAYTSAVQQKQAA
jgi:hypothetical protein